MRRKNKIKKFIILILGVALAVCIASDITAARERPGTKKRSTERKSRKKKEKTRIGLGRMMAIAKNEGDLAQALNRETANYRKVKKAVDHDKLKKGQFASKIKDKYGEPVIILSEEKGNLEKWVYKPGRASFFDEKKVYLIFDSDERLVEWRSVLPKKDPVKPAEH